MDIIPPRKAKRKNPEPESEEFWSLSRVILLSVAIVMGIAIFSYFNFAKAEVKIWPRTEEVKSDQLVTVKETATAVSKGTIPGKMISSRVEGSQQFEASKVDKKQKAQGKVRIYNEASRNITLVKGSQLISASQKLYLLDSRTTLPAAQWSGGEKQPGHADVTVTAAEAGKDHNVKETKFSFPGLNGTALYHQIYAATITEIRGGLDGESYQVTEQGVNEAKEEVRNELKKQGKKRLEEKDYNIVPGTLGQSVAESFVSAQPGMTTDKFTVQEKINTKAFAFEQESLKRLVEKAAQEQLEGGKIDNSSLTIKYEVSEVYPDQGRALMNVEFSAKVYSPVDEKELKREIQGMSLSDLYSWLGQKRSVARTEITTWPYWLRSLPSDRDRINIKVLIE